MVSARSDSTIRMSSIRVATPMAKPLSPCAINSRYGPAETRMYNDHYGFSERPFQLTPDPRFWFESQTHRKAMAYLGYGLAQGEGFIAITGDIGAGKTTLVGHLLQTIDRARYTPLNIVSTQVEGDDMLRLAAQGLGLSSEGVAKAQILDRIERTLDEQARLGKHVLIIVDEAQ